MDRQAKKYLFVFLGIAFGGLGLILIAAAVLFMLALFAGASLLNNI